MVRRRLSAATLDKWLAAWKASLSPTSHVFQNQFQVNSHAKVTGAQASVKLEKVQINAYTLLSDENMWLESKYKTA